MKKRPWIFYGWIVAAISFVTLLLIYGLRYSFSVFYVVILDEFGWSRADTALIFSASIITYGVLAPISGALMDRFGPRVVLSLGALFATIGGILCSRADSIWQFFILFGIIYAAGTALGGWVPNTAVISNWFIRKRGLAFAIFTGGFGASFLVPIAAERLISVVGWRGAFVIMGALIGIIVIPLVAIFQRHRPQDMGLQPDGVEPEDAQGKTAKKAIPVEALVVDKKWAATEWTLLKAFKTYRFWTLLLAMFCAWGIGQNMMVTHQVAFAVDLGHSRMFGALVFSLYGVVYLVGNFLGFVSDRWGREPVMVLGFTGASLGILMLVIASVIGEGAPTWFFYLYIVFFGLGTGINGATLTAAVADIFQGKHFGSIYGFIVAGFGVGGALSPWLGGRIHDVTGRYTWAFATVVIAFIIACIMMLISSPGKVRRVSGKVKNP